MLYKLRIALNEYLLKVITFIKCIHMVRPTKLETSWLVFSLAPGHLTTTVPTVLTELISRADWDSLRGLEAFSNSKHFKYIKHCHAQLQGMSILFASSERQSAYLDFETTCPEVQLSVRSWPLKQNDTEGQYDGPHISNLSFLLTDTILPMSSSRLS